MTTVVVVEASLIRVSPKSQWILAEIVMSDRTRGAGEASLHFQAADVRDAVIRYGEAIKGLSPAEALSKLSALGEQDIINISARCALDQALHDVMGQVAGKPICGMICVEPASKVEVYANINRRTFDRSPMGFATSARHAVASGFSALKIAPFDRLTPGSSSADAKSLIEAGIARIAAVREAIGVRRLLVDCHWRLAPAWLPSVAAACAEFKVFWIETPYPEDLDRIEDIHRARKEVNRRGMLLAGCELKTGHDGFVPFIGGGCYDVLMPDMKYVGGYAEFLAVADAAAMCGMKISPHNPTGPICHAHSVHASAATRDLLILEMQFDETPAFNEIVAGELPLPQEGVVTVPQAPGLGLRLLADRMAPIAEAT